MGVPQLTDQGHQVTVAAWLVLPEILLVLEKGWSYWLSPFSFGLIGCG